MDDIPRHTAPKRAATTLARHGDELTEDPELVLRQHEAIPAAPDFGSMPGSRRHWSRSTSREFNSRRRLDWSATSKRPSREWVCRPSLIELELTESLLMEASRDHNELLRRLCQKGYRLAIDDFGSGYSSLDYLRRYPVDRIKIAQAFTSEIGIQPGNDAIVRAALGLARELHIEVVVEGVETIAQLELLSSWGGRIVQRYYFSKPLPVAEATALLRFGKVTRADLTELKIADPI
jgi:hypothetical protein